MENNSQYWGLYPCPKCGDFIEKDSKTCPSCKASLVEKVVGSKGPAHESSAIERSLFICSNCGAFIGINATQCNACGTKRASLAVEMDDFLKEKRSRPNGQTTADSLLESSQDIYICENCGALLGSNSDHCEFCGIKIEEFEDVDESEEEEDWEVTQEAAEDDLLSSEGGLFLCTECGAFISSNSSACGICGTAVKDMKADFLDKEIEPVKADSKLSTPGVLFICDKCGAFLKNDSKECSICGTKILKELKYGEEEISPVEVQIEDIITQKAFEMPGMTGSDLLKEADEIASKLKKRKSKMEILDDCIRLWYKKAVALRKLGRYTESLKSLNNALSLSKKDKTLLLEKGDILYEIGRYKQAAKLYLHLLESDPKNLSLLNKVGNALFRLGHQNESLVCFEKALSLDANNKETLVNKGYLLLKQEKYDEAMECANKIMVCSW
ncbi:MAG: zinc ribbon domain-containing protein [Thermoplasmata archaeon]